MDFSPLNYISAELRNRIFAFALSTPGDITIMLADLHHWRYNPIIWQNQDWSLGPHMINPPTHQSLLALSQTCKQLRHETLPVLLAQNRFKILAHIAIGSAEKPHEISFIATQIFEWYSTFGPYAQNMHSLEIFLGDNDKETGQKALSNRQELITGTMKLFQSTGFLPSFTMELQLPVGPPRLHVAPLGAPLSTRRFPVVVGPIKIDLTTKTMWENGQSIDQAISLAKESARQHGYATSVYMASLEDRRKRAIFVLESLHFEQPVQLAYRATMR